MTEGAPSSPSPNEFDIFLAALEQRTPAERAAYLAGACAGNSGLRNAVETLLEHHREDDFLETPVLGGSRPEPEGNRSGPGGTVVLPVLTEKPGDRIGRYRLLQPVGEGGAGTVFMAEQEEPIRRRVALKVLKPGMDTKSVIARFETERQALALMDHPNIARVLDGGATDAGRPFFVMELVRGIRITEYCDQSQLAVRERLRLFIQVCQAIQHAHQKGVIHRDIKPSNILVTVNDGVPVPKVIDFGIAKALDQRLTDKTFFTEFRAFIGTPAYMSPEQAEMSSLDIDTRTDVYSLGVLLYEMLTGTPPFDAEELLASGLDGLRRTLREREPVPPSTRRTRESPAQPAKSPIADLKSQIDPDLDWIVLKTLEKDRTRRYETASALAADVQRYLDNEPILARPPSALYRFQKMVRRNRLGFAVGGAFAGALVIGLALSTWQYLEKSAAYRRATEAESEQSRLRSEAEAARRQAERQALLARRKAYAADMNMVQQALAMNNLGRAQSLLDAQRPLEQSGIHSPKSEIDLCGWEWRYLWQRCRSDALFTLCQLSNEVCTLTPSADGTWVAVGDSDGGLAVMDVRTRQEVVRLSAGGGRVQAAFSPTAPILAFSATDGPWFPSREQRIRLWDVARRRSIGDLPLGANCRGLAFSPDGARLLVADADGQVTLWQVSDGKALATNRLSRIAWFGAPVQASRDLRLVAYGTEGGGLCVWDLERDQPRWNVPAADENVLALAFSPDGQTLASGAGYVESSIRLWEVATGTELGRLEGHRTWISSLVFWPDGRTLASASADQTIRLWDLASRQTKTTLRGHRLEVWSLALLPDHSTVVSGCKDGSAYVWDTTRLPRDEARFTLPEPVRAWRFSADGQSLLTLDLSGRLARWPGPDFHEPQTEATLGPGVSMALFSADGGYLVAGMSDGRLQVWDVPQRMLACEWKAEGVQAYPVGFLPPSNHLVTRLQGEDSFQEWDLVTGQEVHAWLASLEPGPRSAVAFSPDARWSFLLDAYGAGRLRNLATSQETLLDLNLKQVSQVTFSPDGRVLAAVSRLGTCCLWETAPAARIASLQGFLQGMNSVAFSPDAARLAIGGDGQEAVKVWDLESLQELVTLSGQGSLFGALAFAPDHNILAASNGQGILHLWRAPSFEEIERIESQRR